MARTYTVAQGDCITSIARRHGFTDPKAIYEHASNADLRALRPNMHVLHPGDVVNIPDVPRKQVSCPTEKRSTFTVKLPKKKLCLVIRDAKDRPMGGIAYVLRVGETRFEGKTTREGRIEQQIDALATHATLKLGAGSPMPLRIGFLNPMRDVPDGGVSGVQARLHNLGYAPGPVDGVLGDTTAGAIRRFQRDVALEETGEIDDALVTKLEQAYGC